MQFAQTGQALGASYRFGERVGSGAVGEVWTVPRPTAGLLPPRSCDRNTLTILRL